MSVSIWLAGFSTFKQRLPLQEMPRGEGGEVRGMNVQCPANSSSDLPINSATAQHEMATGIYSRHASPDL